MMILDACGFHPAIGINVLAQKALITISPTGRFEMHDLVQEMAHYIVRGQHPKNPEKITRIWKEEDVRTICAMDATANLDRIETIRFSSEKHDKLEHVLRVAANMKKLRWMDLKYIESVFESPFPLLVLSQYFPPRELCCLTLDGLHVKQLWEGYKYLPNLRMIKLEGLYSLMKTADFSGLPNLERFMVYECPLLEEIDPSFGRLEKLVCVEICGCQDLEMLPPITRSKKLETFVLSRYRLDYYRLEIQQSSWENCVPQNMNHIALWSFSGCLRKLDLGHCGLTDGDMIRYVADWELPNLQQLNLRGNGFSRLDFGLLRLPRLRYLNISLCKYLVELSELPSSIYVVVADNCTSLETLGDISNCKSLWKVSLWGPNKLGPLGGDILLDSMLQGNVRDHFMSINVSDILRWCAVLCADWVETGTMRLPDDWYNDYSGILMFVRSDTHDVDMGFNISIKQDTDEGFQSQVWQEPIVTPEYDRTYVGYVSFSSLRHSGCLNSTFSFISFSLEHKIFYGYRCRCRVVLVPKDDPMLTMKSATDCSEFWDEGEVYGTKTFTIQHDANASIRICWKPLSHWRKHSHRFL